jgi:tetratricopeptide (TPR) repeat protein
LFVLTPPSARSGCSHDPNVRKQKYYEWTALLRKGKYREAAISTATPFRLIRYSDARYRLGLTYLRLGEPNRACQELQRTVELDPTNYAARVDIANMLIAAKFYKEARNNSTF